MFMNRTRLGMGGAALASALIAPVLFASTALAVDDADGGSTAKVDVSVTVDPYKAPGALSLSIAPGPVKLTEEGSTGTYRQFTGELPLVTVTDTRDAASLSEDARWTVTGASSAFGAIPAHYLGWTPHFWGPGDPDLFPTIQEGSPARAGFPEQPGDEPDNVGLAWPNTLLMAEDVKKLPRGGYLAGADLTLRMPVTQDAGTYTGTISLSLFE